ncbi:hypothetical protein SOASR029_25290 [Budvicia aquatica]|nr:hypothetical protein SOASR029_25290 [Budvicia aquatica]
MKRERPANVLAGVDCGYVNNSFKRSECCYLVSDIGVNLVPIKSDVVNVKNELELSMPDFNSIIFCLTG